MLKSIIEEIYCSSDNIRDLIKPSDLYQKASSESIGLYDKLKDCLNEEQSKLFESFADKELEVQVESEFTFFKYGFKLGLMLAFECIN